MTCEYTESAPGYDDMVTQTWTIEAGSDGVKTEYDTKGGGAYVLVHVQRVRYADGTRSEPRFEITPAFAIDNAIVRAVASPSGFHTSGYGEYLWEWDEDNFAARASYNSGAYPRGNPVEYYENVSVALSIRCPAS